MYERILISILPVGSASLMMDHLGEKAFLMHSLRYLEVQHGLLLSKEFTFSTLR